MFLPKLGSKFSRTKSFCFENWIFYSHSAYSYVRESVKDSGHGIGHVDIRVGSCNCLDVIVCHGMCT